jgi:hypothetical protein
MLVILLKYRRCAEIRWAVRFVVALFLTSWISLPVSAHAEIKFTPAAIVTGRYDSNIFNRPSQFLPPGTQTSDFVSSVGGAVHLMQETRDIQANLTVGGDFNAFVENTGLNYFNARLNGNVILDRWVDQYVRGARLRVTDNFRYTPETPGFVTGVRAPVGVGDDTFSRGIQGFRANTFENILSINGSYPMSRDLSLEGGYIFAIRRVGRIIGGDIGGVAFFDTNTHTWSGGPRYQLTKNDSVAAVYRQTFMTQTLSDSGGRDRSTSLISLLGDYTKVFPEWTFTLEGGVTFVEPVGRTFPSGMLKVTTQPERDTVVNLTLSRQARPSFFLQSGATISNLGQIGISHRIYERLTVEGHAAYAYNQLFPNTDQTFNNLTTGASLSYKLTRNITGTILYSFTNIDVDRTSLAYQFSRHQAGFLLTAEWN